MLRYLLTRIAGLVPLLIGVTFVSFLVINLAPGSPVELMTDLNPKAGPEVQQRLEKEYGLDKPLPVQYWIWVSKLARGDFGRSFQQDRRPVLDKIKEALPVTLALNVMSLAIVLCVAIPIGVYSATHQYSLGDRATTVFVFVGFAMPSFWFALLCILFFSVHLGWLPISGLRSFDHNALSDVGRVLDIAKHLILPVCISGFTSLAAMSRYMRSSMLEVIRQDYINTARAKGLDERTVTFRHALRNALLPIITLLGLSIPGLIGGSVIMESIFAIPGMGRLFFQSILARDYPLIMGVLVMSSMLTLIGNLAADLMYAVADPRLRKR